jgi:hypothetical protein
MKCLRIVSIVSILLLFSITQGISAQKTVIPLYTPGAGGTAYIMGGAMATVLNKHIPEVQMMVEATDGTVALCKLIQEKAGKNQPAFGLPDSKVTYMAYKGEPPFAKPIAVLRAIGLYELAGIYLVVAKNSPIKSYSDLKGKRVGVGAAGSGTAQMSVQLINEHGITAKMFKPVWLGYNEVAEGIQDGSIDAGFISGTYPVPAIEQLAYEKEIRIIPVNKGLLKKITDANPFFVRFDLKPGAYKGVTEGASILAFGAFMVTHDRVDADLVYRITKTLFEHHDELVAICPQLTDMTLRNAQRTIAIPFHPGAIKYYKEMGVMK